MGRGKGGCRTGYPPLPRARAPRHLPHPPPVRIRRQEVRILSRLSHPRIVRFLAASTDPPSVFLVEELAEGGSLHDRLHSGRRPGGGGGRRRRRQLGTPLPYGKLLQVAADVAEAMVYLHEQGVTHRDLKPQASGGEGGGRRHSLSGSSHLPVASTCPRPHPSTTHKLIATTATTQNVLLDGRGRALVTDFGISRFCGTTLVTTQHGQAGTVRRPGRVLRGSAAAGFQLCSELPSSAQLHGARAVRRGTIVREGVRVGGAPPRARKQRRLARLG